MANLPVMIRVDSSPQYLHTCMACFSIKCPHLCRSIATIFGPQKRSIFSSQELNRVDSVSDAHISFRSGFSLPTSESLAIWIAVFHWDLPWFVYENSVPQLISWFSCFPFRLSYIVGIHVFLINLNYILDFWSFLVASHYISLYPH